MRAVMLYHPASDHERLVLDYARDWEAFKGPGKTIELVSLETAEGADMAKLYDITVYPALLAISNDGHLHQVWQGTTMPLMNELDSYMIREG